MSGALKRDEWETVRLGDVCEIGDGLHGTPKYDEHGEYYFINGTNLSNGRIIFDEKTKRVDENTYKKYRIEFGNTLLMSINGTIGNIAYYADEKIVLGKSAAYITTKTPNLNLTYLSHYLQSATAKQYYENNLTGSTIKNLGLKVLRSFELPIPPLDIQRRIADTLDKVTELITLRKTQLEKLDELVKARFVELFGNRGENPYNFPMTTMGNIYKFQYGKGNNIPEDKGEYPCYGSNGIVGHHTEYNSEDSPIIGHIGAYAGIVNWGKGKHYVTYNGVICKLINDQVNPVYGYYLLQLQDYNTVAKSGAAQPFVSYKDLDAPVVNVPPLEVQNQFSAFVEQTDKAKAPIQQSLETLETLKKSLMQEYFG